jgi:pilus assembly protein CpaC
MKMNLQRFAAGLALGVSLLAAAMPSTPAWAQAAAADAQSYGPAAAPGVIRVNLSAQGSGGELVAIPRGKSAIVELPVDARDVLVTNPTVAEAVLRSPRRIYILGVAAGQTDAVFFDAGGRRILGLNIRVDQDYGAVAQTIARLLPGSKVHVDAANNSVILSGVVADIGQADKAVQIAQQFTAKPEQVLNMLSIAGKDQVMLKVRIVEMQRNVIKQLGFNLSVLTNQLGSPQFLVNNAASFGVNGALLGGLTAGGQTNGGANKIASSVQAFERVGLVRTLAEPNLTAVSGESARFLAGGEFPVPTGQDNTGKITIDFKPYGVGLGFTPIVLSSGRISLKISTEVSELTDQGSFSVSNGAGVPSLVIPGLTVRRAETTVELPSGGAMAIAGLLQSSTKQDIDSVPGLASLPVLGALFRSRDYLSGETELVVIVTPYLVKATSPENLQTPADGLQIANDAETILFGQLNKTYRAPPAAAAAGGYQGPVGYVIE